eukprot:Skav206113  [mRNA]  locus=scaffold3261:44575:49089:+ [translate_table: standard]
MVEEHHGSGASGLEAPEGFSLPFGVATLEDLQQRAYINKDGKPEWVWARVHHYCQIQKEPGRLLMQNQAAWKQELQKLQVPPEGVHFRGKDAPIDERGWKDHTLESRALCGILACIIKQRQGKALSKVRALKLFLELADRGFAVRDPQVPLTCSIQKPQGQMVAAELQFTPQQVSKQWGSLLALSPGGVRLWQKLTTRTWLNRCIISSMDNATLMDIMFFSLYLLCHQTLKAGGQVLWMAIGNNILPEIIFMVGSWMDTLASRLQAQPLAMLPILRTKKENARRQADPVNRMLLLWKMRNSKQHRREVAGSHADLGGNTNRMVRYEAYIDCLLHSQVLERELGGHKQVSVAWDPSSYGGKDIFIGCVYVPSINKAAYLLSQELAHTTVGELDASLFDLAKGRKLTRLEGYREIKGLAAALEGIGVKLQDFYVPTNLVLRPLASGEYRVQGPHGRWYIVHEEDMEATPVCPDGVELGSLPSLISISDQGPSNTAALNFMLFSSNAMLMWALWDPFHRAWNDLKLALKRSVGKGWRTVLELTLVCNMNYGPFGSGTWFFKKKSKLQDFLFTQSVTGQAWGQMQPWIAQERRVPEPSNLEEASSMFESLSSLNSFCQKGPLIKLMRWFSFFESMAFYEGEFYAIKLILEHANQHGEQGSDAEVDENVGFKEEKDDKKELAALKKRKGTWKLAPTLINGKSMCMKDCIMSIGKATWKNFSQNVREIVSPLQVKEMNIAHADRRFWCDELVEIMRSSLEDDRLIKHLYPEFQSHDQALAWHCDLFTKLMETRGMSLAVFHWMPPMTYCHVLSFDPEVRMQAHQLALSHWKIILQAEDAKQAGAVVKPLETIHWRLNPLVRALFLAFEDDEYKGRVGTADSSAMKMMVNFAQNLGDSRLVENIHQHGRDLCRASKTNSMANTSIFSNVLRSGVLEQKKVPVVKFEDSDKVLKSWTACNKEPVVKKLRTHHKSLPLEMQKMMAPKNKSAGGEQWPSPSPGSLFQSVASTHWLWKYFSAPAGAMAGGANCAWKACLASPGQILVQKSTNLVIMVVASAEFSFLGVSMEVREALHGLRTFHCILERHAIAFHHIAELEDWMSLPAEPCLTNAEGTRGPVGWKQTGDPLLVDAAALINGCPLTFQQLKDLLRETGVNLPKQPSKKSVAELLISIIVPEEMQEVARAHFQGKGPKNKEEDDGMDSDLSEVLSELAQDDANTQDLKDWKEKKKHHRNKKAFEKAEELMKDDSKKKAKGKGKGRGRGKGKGKGEGKGKAQAGGFLESLVNRARRLLAEKKKRDQDMFVERELAEEMKGQEQKAGFPDTMDPEELRQAKASEAKADDAAGGAGDEVQAMEQDLERQLLGEPEGMEVEGGEGEEVVGREPASASARPRAPKQKSPAEIMAMLEPPGCSFGISFQDHRFTSVWQTDYLTLDKPYSQKRLSRSFGNKRDWVRALQEVHSHNWKKWEQVKLEEPLAEGQAEQKPGFLSKEVLDELRPIIDKLEKEPVTRYKS